MPVVTVTFFAGADASAAGAAAGAIPCAGGGVPAVCAHADDVTRLAIPTTHITLLLVFISPSRVTLRRSGGSLTSIVLTVVLPRNCYSVAGRIAPAVVAGLSTVPIPAPTASCETSAG